MTSNPVADTIRALRVQGIDHVEMFVPDQYEAARWYESVFGLEIIREFEFWASDGGPLMISSDGGVTKLALFEGEPQAGRATAGFHRVAFHVDGTGFLQFLNRLDETPMVDHHGRPVTSSDAFDHALSWSVYFCDPWGHRFEVTTYDYQLVASHLAATK